jgi:hypothetical protein
MWILSCHPLVLLTLSQERWTANQVYKWPRLIKRKYLQPITNWSGISWISQEISQELWLWEIRRRRCLNNICRLLSWRSLNKHLWYAQRSWHGIDYPYQQTDPDKRLIAIGIKDDNVLRRVIMYILQNYINIITLYLVDFNRAYN